MARAESEAAELSENPFGGVLLSLIGHCYVDHCHSDSGGLSGLNVSLQQTGRSLSHTATPHHSHTLTHTLSLTHTHTHTLTLNSPTD